MLKFLAKKTGIREKALKSLVVFTLLVYEGIKPGYLVDSCCLSPIAAKAFLSNLCQQYKLDRSILRIISMGEDIFIVNQPIVAKNLQSDLLSTTPKAVIDLDLDLVSDISYYHIHLEALLSVVDAAKNCMEVELPLSSELYSEAGGPFVAGCLLSYPVVYKAKPTFASSSQSIIPTYEAASSKLSFTELVKFTIAADISIAFDSVPYLCCKDRDSTLESAQINKRNGKAVKECSPWPLFEFSFPRSLVKVGSAEHHSISTSVQSLVEQVSLLSDLSTSVCSMQISSIRVAEEAIQTEGISL